MSSGPETSVAQPVPATPGLSRWSALGLVLGWLACVLLLVYLLEIRPRSEPQAPRVETVATVAAGFPAPPEGAVVYSRQLGRDALALGVLPDTGQVVVQASVVDPEGEGVPGLDVTFGVSGQTASGRVCGDGCYRAELPAEVPPRAIDVVISGAATGRWSVPLPARWPPQNAAPLVARTGRVWRSLRSLSFEEALASGPQNVVRSSWTVEAPDRFTYRIAGGTSAVIIGKRRWDKSPGEGWKPASQSPIRQPTPPWVRPTDAHVVRTTTVDGRPASVVTFFDPNTPAWFRLVVDRETLRTLDLRMVATAHFMHDRLHSFDKVPAIRPPVALP